MSTYPNLRFLNRRMFLVQGSAALAGLASGSVMSTGRSGWGRSSNTKTVEAKTAYGRLRGKRTGDLVTFKGVPYAGSVSGVNRFKAPPPLAPWTGVREAFTSGPPAVQPKRPSFGVDEPFPSEDCLVLNIWTPAVDQRRRPVLFYNHGGGFVIGSGSTWYQDGSNLAREYDVVVVANNHRLGLLGYLFLADLAGEEYVSYGNQGILDISAALKCVHENIDSFGGDPNNVMVFGESGGGAKTSCIYALPLAKNYFNKASIESGPGVHMTPRDMATETAKMVLTEDGLKAQLNKDFGSNAETILTTYRKSRLTATPSDLYVAITTARAMWLGSIEIAEKKYEQKAAPVYMYMFTHESNLLVPGTDHRLGAAHATEIWYKFDNVDLQEPKNAPGPSLIGTDPDRKKAARNMSEMWATFARDGHPGAKGQPVWPAYTSTSVNELRGARSERQRGTRLF